MKSVLSFATTFTHAPASFNFAVAEEAHVIKTRRLYMRPVSYTDLDDYVELLSDPEVMKFVGLETGKLMERLEVMTMIDRSVAAWEDRGWGRWSIFDHEGEFIGFCGFRVEEDLPELLVLIGRRFWDRDIATEAAFKCIEYGRKVFGFGEINAFTHPGNLRSRRLLAKLGAIYEGDIDFHGIVGSKYSLPRVLQAAA